MLTSPAAKTELMHQNNRKKTIEMIVPAFPTLARRIGLSDKVDFPFPEARTTS